MKRIILVLIGLTLVSGMAWGQFPNSPISGGGGSSTTLATDTLWDAAGDLAYGTGSNTGGRLAIGTAYQLLMTNSGATAPAWTSTLGATGTRLTKGWFTDLEITNAPSINGTAISANGVSLITAADYAAMKALLDLEIGTDVQAYNAYLATIAVGDTANKLLGMNAAGDALEYKSTINVQLDDSAAQFNSATASKGTRKLVQSSIDNGILLTDTPVVTGNATVTTPSLGAGTYTQVFAETDNSFTGANTIGDGGDDQRIVSRINATNERWSGHTMYFAQCAASMGFGQPAYIQSTGKPGLADADAAATMPAIGLVVVASTDADTPCTILTHGSITDTDWNWTPGATIYVADGDAGAITATLGDISDTDDVVQVMGIAIHADSIFVNPTLATITLE